MNYLSIYFCLSNSLLTFFFTYRLIINLLHYLPTYLFPYLPTYLLNLLYYLPTFLVTYLIHHLDLFTYLTISRLSYLPTYLLGYLLSYYRLSHLLVYFFTCRLSYLRNDLRKL